MNFFRKRVLILTFSILLMITNAIYAVEYTQDSEFSFGIQPEDGALSTVEKYGDFEYVRDDRGIYITAYKGSDSTVNVPSMINGQKVLIIYSETFSYCDTVKRVNIPSTVNTIYNDAFINCQTLEWIEVDSANTVYASNNGILYDKNFDYLVVCPAGRTGTVNIVNGCLYVCDYSFYMCDKVTSVNIPSSVIDIDQSTFWITPALTNITIDRLNKNYVMEDSILYAINDNKKVKVVKCLENKTSTPLISSTVTEIGKYAFYDCNKITGSIYIPRNVEKIGEFAFAYCKSLNGTLTLPDSLQTIETGAFMYCSNLQDIIWGNGITEIPERCFAYCTSLKNLNLPDCVDTIGNCAFFSCTEVESLKFGNSTRIIGDNSFGWMTELKGDLIIPDSAQVIGVAAFSESSLVDGFIVIGNKTLEIKESAFYSCNNAKGIVFRGSAPIINAYTFLKPDIPYYHLANKYGFDGGYYASRDIRIYSENPTISFIADGKIYKTETLSSYGMSVEEFENPTFPNLRFLGWYYDQDYTKEFKFTDTFMDNVTIYAKTELKNKLSFPDEEIKVEITQGGKLSVNYELEEGASYEDIIWESQDKSIATVDNQGNISGVSVGETTITASYKNAQATIKVIIWQDVERLSFNEERISAEIDDELELEYDYHFIGDSTVDDIEWLSSDDDVVSVENGKIVAHREGNATIAAMYKDIVATIDITVLKKNVLNIIKDEYVLRQGQIVDIDFEYYFNDGATSDDIIWTSSNTDVAEVSKGRITANTTGDTVITATYQNISSSVNVKVVKPDEINFDSNSLIIENNVDTYELPYSWYSYDVKQEDIVWTSSNSDVATVENGIITIHDLGSVAIGAVCGSSSATIDITIVRPNELNIVDNNKNLRYNMDEIIDLDIEYYFYDNATKDDIVYTSSDENVIAVVNNKLVQKGYGQAIVTASYCNVSDTIYISIIPQDNITFEKFGYMIKPTESLELEYNYYFKDLPLDGITFSSSDEKIATVDENGMVTAVSEGEVTITAQCNGVIGKVKVVVTPHTYLRGDMDFDGFVNSTDAAIVLDRFKNGNTVTIDIIVGDLTGDAFLNSTDAALILDIYKD